MTFDQVIQIIVTGAMILGGTWKLSSQISAVSTKLDEHIKGDNAKFREIDADLNAIAPRVVRLERARR